MGEKSSVTELRPTCQFCKQDDEEENLTGDIEVYVTISNDEAEEAYKSA
jgi:hypothetical protein